MWFSRLCATRSIITHYFLVPKSHINLNRAFSISSLIGKNAKTIKNPFQTIKFINKPISNLKWFIGRQMTLSTKQKAPDAPKIIGYWLVGCAFMVYVAIVLGGYTRLTESGLSMVTWRFSFEKYISSEEDWKREFEKYQQFPEYQLLKKELTMEEFQKIWKTEFFHRMWGRFVGLAFILPGMFFWLRGHFRSPMKKRFLLFTSLIGAQGLMGWYMVQSGLEDKFHEPSDIPRVSQYRLAAHLTLALLLYSGLLWTAFDLITPARQLALKESAKKLKILTHCSKGFVFLTAITGAFVSGLDAGLIYNSFPKMGDKWIPDDILAKTPVYTNFTENPTTVQFIHRIMGVTTLSLCVASRMLSAKYDLPRPLKLTYSMLFIIACYQAYLGYSTLINHVPQHTASAHQSTATMLLGIALLASHHLKNVKYLAK